MGWKSTLEITRDDAIEAIHWMARYLERVDNQTLSNTLEALNDDLKSIGWGYNFSVVSEYSGEDTYGELPPQFPGCYSLREPEEDGDDDESPE